MQRCSLPFWLNVLNKIRCAISTEQALVGVWCQTYSWCFITGGSNGSKTPPKSGWTWISSNNSSTTFLTVTRRERWIWNSFSSWSGTAFFLYLFFFLFTKHFFPTNLSIKINSCKQTAVSESCFAADASLCDLDTSVILKRILAMPILRLKFFPVMLEESRIYPIYLR